LRSWGPPGGHGDRLEDMEGRLEVMEGLLEDMEGCLEGMEGRRVERPRPGGGVPSPSQ
jgi:hypothetical protein